MNRINGYSDSFVDQTGFRQHGGIYSGIARGNIVLQSSGQISISGTNVSLITGEREILTYIPDSGLGWCAKAPLLTTGGPGNSGIFPIALSGLYSLDMAYQANKDIFVRQPYGTLSFFSVNLRPRFIGTGRAAFNISGVLSVPVGPPPADRHGDIFMCRHSVLTKPPNFANSPLNNFVAPTTEEEVDARALGVPTLMLDTGSGIINFSIGSGIAFMDTQGQTVIDNIVERYTRIRLHNIISDLNYAIDDVASGIKIFSPGLYRARYNVSIEKTGGTTLQAVAIRAVLYRSDQNATIQDSTAVIDSSIGYGAVQNGTAYRFGTITNEFYFNADAGAFFGIEVSYANLLTSLQSIVINTSGTNVSIEKIGPKRGRNN